jgi:site-specific recombinase
MKHLKLFEDVKKYYISDKIIEDNMDQIIQVLQKGSSLTDGTDAIDAIQYFKRKDFEEAAYEYKYIITEIMNERLCYHIVKAVEKDPALYAKYKEFIDEMIYGNDEDWNWDGSTKHKLPEHLKRGEKTGLWDLKTKEE